MELLDAKDVKRILKVSLPFVYKLAERGQLPYVRIPAIGKGSTVRGVIRFKLDDIQSFIERHYRATT
jgi:hypothetical protein